MPPLYHELCQSGVGQQTTPEQGGKVASQQKTLCVQFTILRTTIGHLLGKVVIAFESTVWGRSNKRAEVRGYLFNLILVVKWWGDPCWSQQYLSPRFSSFYAKGCLWPLTESGNTV